MTRKLIVYSIALCTIVLVVYLVFYSPRAREVYSDLSWMRITSLAILVVGCFYAIIERSILIGAVTFVAAAVLPWVKFWVMAYWPWFKYYCLHISGG